MTSKKKKLRFFFGRQKTLRTIYPNKVCLLQKKKEKRSFVIAKQSKGV
jgi:hypothetical protein